MYNKEFEYSYNYYWVKKKTTGAVLIGEKRIEKDGYISWELAGSDLGYEEEDFEILSRVEDYNVN